MIGRSGAFNASLLLSHQQRRNERQYGGLSSDSDGSDRPTDLSSSRKQEQRERLPSLTPCHEHIPWGVDSVEHKRQSPEQNNNTSTSGRLATALQQSSPPSNTTRVGPLPADHHTPPHQHQSGHGVGGDWRMNTSGSERGAMTGSNSSSTNSETRTWLGDTAPSHHRHRHHPLQGSRTTTGGATRSTLSPVSESNLMLSAVNPILFRGSSSGTEPNQRLFPLRGGGSDTTSGSGSAHYAPIYTASSSASCMPPYSPAALYSGHPAVSSLSSLQQYSSYYPQLSSYSVAAAAAAAAGGLLPATYPHMDQSHPYASALANIGSQVQPQLPRAPFMPPHLPHQYGSPANSPGPTRSHTPRERDSKSPLRHLSTSKDTKHLHSPTNYPHKLQQNIYPKEQYRIQQRKRIIPRPLDIAKHEDESTNYKRHRASPSSLPSNNPPLPLPPTWNSPTGSHGLPPPPPLQSNYPAQPHYPPHFMKGSVIQLANGELKRVEDLRTDDFVNSADVSGDLKIDSSTVVRIDENTEKGSAILGFSVGEHRVHVSTRKLKI